MRPLYSATYLKPKPLHDECERFWTLPDVKQDATLTDIKVSVSVKLGYKLVLRISVHPLVHMPFLLLFVCILFSADARAQMFGDGPSSSGFGFLFGDSPPVLENKRPRIIIRSRRPKPQATTDGNNVFCVRTCDGFYFRIQTSRSTAGNESQNGTCKAFCPASPTTLYSTRNGNDIENSVDGKGNRYSKLPNALRFRKEIVPACSCQTKPGDGLADLPLTQDATLRKGDMIVSKTGVRIFKGSDSFPYRDADFSKPQTISQKR
jgi:hypothetical protein